MGRTEILFAHWAVRAQKDARGPRWRKLVQEIAVLPEAHPNALAFHLMMVRLNGCVTCDARKYSERGGCARCAAANLSFSKESERGLLARYRVAREQVAQALKAQKASVAKAA